MLDTPPVPIVRALEPGVACFVLSRLGADGVWTPNGAVRQAVIATHDGSERVIDITQTLPRGVTLRDVFIVDADDLRPRVYTSTLNGRPHALLRYEAGHVSGYWMEGDDRRPVDADLPDPVWDASLWGPLFGVLDLRPGATLTLPNFHYRLGTGAFTLTPAGEAASGSDPRGAWRVRVEAMGSVLEYVIDKATGAELANEGGGFRQVRTPCVDYDPVVFD